MAEVDDRVIRLIDALMERGFGWLAAEIVEVFETGRRYLDDADGQVKAQRSALNESIADGAYNETRSERVRSASLSESFEFAPFSASEQARIAVDIVIESLISTTSMMSESEVLLSRVMNRRVVLAANVDNEVRRLDVAASVDAARRLQSMRNELIEWLGQQP